MTKVRFGRDAKGGVTMHVPEGHQPLWDLLRTDLRHDRQGLNEVLDYARNPCEDEGMGTNSTSITVTQESVVVENDFTDETVTLPRAEFIEIIETYQRELDTAATEKTQ